MKKLLLGTMACAMLTTGAYAACSAKEATAAVEKACEMIKANVKGGKTPYAGLETFRFCGDNNNYVWVQKYDSTGKTVFLSYHPVSAGLMNQDMLLKEGKIKELFTSLGVALTKAYETGKPQTVEYKWAKQGATEPTDKLSVMAKCTDTEGVGGGYWK